MSVVATATGVSAAESLPAGEYVLQFSSAGAFALSVEVGDGTNYHALYMADNTTAVEIDSATGPRHIVVLGGMHYRMNVETYNSAITMSPIKSSR